LRRVPEVQQVFGTVGRGTTPTDNTPMGMVNNDRRAEVTAQNR
jgi:Cu/Ag efflux pump CusA